MICLVLYCGDQLTLFASSSVIVFSTSIGIVILLFNGPVTVELERNYSESTILFNGNHKLATKRILKFNFPSFIFSLFPFI